MHLTLSWSIIPCCYIIFYDYTWYIIWLFQTLQCESLMH
uniref:Uncharacterized protein n=1 Tax=Rhizophora mucronata TaxID=61149 RepID=A0A2P2IMJ5_RHIMU